MGSIYGIVIPKRLKNALQSGNWVQALKQFRNKSDTLLDLRARSKAALDEFILLAEKMPRQELEQTLPPEKIVKLIDAYLSYDPIEEELRRARFEQFTRVRAIETSEEIKEIIRKRENALHQKVYAMSKKGSVSIEEQESIRQQLEGRVWSDTDLGRLQFLEYERDSLWHLDKAHTSHIGSANRVNTKMASDIALAGIKYCSGEIRKVLDNFLATRVTDDFDDAIKLLTFIPAKVASESANTNK